MNAEVGEELAELVTAQIELVVGETGVFERAVVVFAIRFEDSGCIGPLGGHRGEVGGDVGTGEGHGRVNYTE